MALINLGQLATDARGSIGGVTYSRNKAGNYTRAKQSPVQPRTPAQTLVRANFASNSKLWSGTLTADQRGAWTAFAAANPLTNVFGNSIIVSGLAMMMKLNQVLAQIHVAAITDAPSDLSVPTLAAPTGLSAGLDTEAITISTFAQAVQAGAKYYIFATRGLNAGRKPQSSDYRFVAALAATAAAVELDITTQWEAIFGSLVAGTNIGVLVATVNVATGAVTPGLAFAALVADA